MSDPRGVIVDVPTSHTALTPATLIDPNLRGTVRLLGGPGTGKSALLVRTAVARVAAGTDPESVLLLTGSATLGAHARAAVTAALLGCGGQAAVREPLVRTVHSYAFAVLRLAAQRNGDPPPRLVTSAEQDGVIREMLTGDIADGAASSVDWPPSLWPALGTVGFATELRDLLSRCTERGVDPVALQRLGRRMGRPEWLAAGQFAQAYEQIMLLRSAVGMAAPQATVPALGAAELVGAALDALAGDADLLAAERGRVRLLLVDDAQHLDPQAALLVRVLGAGAELTVLAGDPDQSVFGYRGADPELLRGDSDPAVVLTESHRCAPAVARAVAGVASRLPGGPADWAAGRAITSANDERPGSVAVRIAATAHAESGVIADALRRAHLVDGVPWSQMAVIVRSVPRTGTALARALTAAGVPVDQPSFSAPLAKHPVVADLLRVLEAVVGGLDGDVACALLTGPIGGVDPVSLRQLRRSLRRADGSVPPRGFADLLLDAMTGDEPDLPEHLVHAVRRVRAVLAAARRSHRSGQDPRFVLWQAWHRCGLERKWSTAADRGSSGAVQAGRDLDAVTALFDVAEQYVTRTTGASVAGLVDHVRGMGLPPVARGTAGPVEAVAMLSAHAALGREWDVVVVAGLQEGLWPNTVPRGGILGTQRLVDVLDGVVDGPDAPVSATAPLLAEERRLLVAALGRARSHVVVTAVDSDEGDEAMLPSTFCDELLALATERPDADVPPVRAPRMLTTAALVGRLRAVVCAPADAVDPESRVSAATQLARLAEAGVAGADPAQWYGTTAPSTEAPLWDGADHVVTLSPSTLQTLTDCPLRWVLERHGGQDGRDVRSALGTVVHALVSDSGRSEDEMLADLDALWSSLPFDAEWYSANELDRHRAMLSAFAQWRAQTRAELTEVGTEVDVEGLVAAGDGAAPAVRIRGRIDRLERDAEDRLVVVDVKTGKSPVTKDDAQNHAQLGAYQLAVTEGVLPQGDQAGGGRLVYLGKIGAAGPAERGQDPMSDDGRDRWGESVRDAAAATRGPHFVARVNDGCAHCPVRAMCPARAAAEGRP